MRDLPAPVDANLDDETIKPVFFASFLFDTDPLYVHTELGDISTLGQTWLGTGGLGQVSEIEETSNGNPGLKFRLDTTDESAGSIFEELTQQDYFQREVVVYFSTRDIISGALSADPTETWRGRIDYAEFTYGTEGQETQSFVDVVVENEFLDGKTPLNLLYSKAQIEEEHPGDTGFDYIAALKNTKIVWGGKRTATLGNPGGPNVPDVPVIPEGPGNVF